MPSSASNRRWTWCVVFEPGRRVALRARTTGLLATALPATGLLALAGLAAHAAPALQLDCPPQVPLQEAFDCRVGATVADGATGRVAVLLPLRLMRVDETAGWSFDAGARRWTGPAPANATLTLIADPFARGGTHTLAASLDVAGQPTLEASTGVGVDGGDRIDLGMATLPLPPWIFTAVWLLVMAGLVGAARQRDQRRAARLPRAWPWALGVAVLATMALPAVTALVDQLRARTVFERADCEVLDHAMTAARGHEEEGWPMAALRIRADGETWVGAGFEPRSAVLRTSAADHHLRFPIGSRPACWFDPARPGRVILRQAPVAALLVAPALLAALGVLGVGLRRVW